jgi:transposase
MYARITSSGGRRYLQLVEGYRTEDGKVRQRTIATIGRIDELKGGSLDALINGLNRAVGRADVQTGAVEADSALSYGDVFALHEIWKDLGFDRALQRSLRSGKRKLDVEALVRAMVFNRLCAPDSKLGVLRWLETVAMPAMPSRVEHYHLLRAMDALMDNVDRVEDELAKQIRPLVDHNLTMVFYDLTTVRIHGEGQLEDDLRAFGMNKEKGGVARQFVLGVVQTAEGLPLMHTVHPGNVSETKSLQGMLATVLARFPIQRIILVADRGLLSLDNIHHLTEMADQGARKLEFILAVPARRYGDLVKTFREFDFSDGDGLREASFEGHRLIVAHDAARALEQGESRRARINELEAMGNAMVAKLDRQDEGKSEKGRRASDRGAYSRFVRAIADAELSRFVKADLTADRFSWTVDEDAITQAALFDGKLVLLTNVPEITPEDTVRKYKELSDIERGFRTLKSDIEIAPVHHRLPDRIRAHALICFLALVLYRIMRMRLKAKGHSASPKTALEILAKVQQFTAYIGEKPFTGTTRTKPEQLSLFEALDVSKPA